MTSEEAEEVKAYGSMIGVQVTIQPDGWVYIYPPNSGYPYYRDTKSYAIHTIDLIAENHGKLPIK